MSNVETIRFCDTCDNKLYHRVQDDSLEYFCRVCGNQNLDIVRQGLCVLNIQHDTETNSGQQFEHIINKYTKYDPTLPRIVLPCPNEKCKSNENADKKADVLYLRYDNTQMRHLYMCTTCDYTWKTNSS